MFGIGLTELLVVALIGALYVGIIVLVVRILLKASKK
jgi:hypothetical protein